MLMCVYNLSAVSPIIALLTVNKYVYTLQIVPVKPTSSIVQVDSIELGKGIFTLSTMENEIYTVKEDILLAHTEGEKDEVKMADTLPWEIHCKSLEHAIVSIVSETRTTLLSLLEYKFFFALPNIIST